MPKIFAFTAVRMVGGTYRGSSAGLRNTPGIKDGSFAPASSWSCCNSSLPPSARRAFFAERFFAFSASEPTPEVIFPMRPCFGAGRRSNAGDMGAVAPFAVGDIGAPPGDAGPGEATTTFPGGAATGDAGGGGVTVGGPPPGEVLGRSSAISRQPGDLGDAGSAGAGEVSSKFAWSPGLSPTGPTGEERCGAPAARESAREGIEGERARRGGECEVSDVGWERHFPRP